MTEKEVNEFEEDWEEAGMLVYKRLKSNQVGQGVCIILWMICNNTQKILFACLFDMG